MIILFQFEPQVKDLSHRTSPQEHRSLSRFVRISRAFGGGFDQLSSFVPWFSQRVVETTACSGKNLLERCDHGKGLIADPVLSALRLLLGWSELFLL